MWFPGHTTSIEPDQSFELCEHCGLCCDGTLFDSVALGVEGRRVAVKRQLTVVQTEASARLQHPCAALKGVRCTIYPERPPDCAAYFCGLRQRLRRGSISAVKARAIVRQVQSLRAQVGGGRAWWTQLRAAGRGSQAQSDLPALVELERLVQTHFWE